MHLTDALSVLENYDLEKLQNIIVDIFDVVLESDTMLTPHDINQWEPNIFIKVDVLIGSQVYTSRSVVIVSILPSPEVLHGHIIC